MTLRELITKIGFEVDGKSADDAEKKVKGMSLKMKGFIGAAVAGVFALGVAALTAAGDMEMLTTQFEVMLGSTEAAVSMMDKLKTFAASTPFALEDLATGTQQLLSFGVAENDVIDAMKLLGDTAGGNAEKLNGLVLAYGKVQAKGKASMEEINMLTERGVPIISTLREQLGATEDEFFKLVSAGKISRDDITEAFRTMTSEGGMFFEGMKKQSLTFQGLVSTMKDNVKLMIAGIGETLLPVAKQVVETITELVQGPLGDLVGALVSSLAPVIETVAGLLENIVKAILPLSNILESIMPLIVTILGVVDSLAPVLDIITFVLSKIGEIIEILAPPLNEILIILIDIINTILEMLSAELMSLLEPLTDILISIAEIITTILTLLMPVFKILAKLMALNIQRQVKLVVGVLTFLANLFKIYFDLLNRFYTFIASKLIPIFKSIGETLRIVGVIVKYLFGLFKEWISTIITDIKEFLSIIWNDITSVVGVIGNWILGWVNILKDTVKNIITFISDLLGQFWDWFGGKFPWLSNLINGIGDVFRTMWQSVQDVFIGMWDKVTEGIQKLIGWVNKIPGVELEIPGIEGLTDNTAVSNREVADLLTGGGTPSFTPDVSGGNSTSVSMENTISVAVPEGSNTEAIKTAVGDAARAVFTVELQKILVDAGI